MLLLKKGRAKEGNVPTASVFSESKHAQLSARFSFCDDGWNRAILWSVSCCVGASPLCGAPGRWTQPTSSRTDTPITADKWWWWGGGQQLNATTGADKPTQQIVPLSKLRWGATKGDTGANKSADVVIALVYLLIWPLSPTHALEPTGHAFNGLHVAAAVEPA